MRRQRPLKSKHLLSFPYLLWSAVFILIPLGMIFFYGLTDRTGALTALCTDGKDGDALETVILAVEQRAGKLIAANLAAVLIRMRRGGTQGVIPIAENGTTFQKALPLRKTCMEELQLFTDETGPYRFVAMEDDTLVGTAAAAFLR